MPRGRAGARRRGFPGCPATRFLGSRSGASTSSFLFILFIAALAVLFYYRKDIQRKAPLPAPALPQPAQTPSVAELALELQAEGGAAPKAARKAAPSGREAAMAKAGRLNAAALKEYENGDYGKAEALLSAAVDASGEPVYARNLAAVKLKLGDMEGAASLLSPLKDDPLVRPTLKGIYIALGNRAAQRGDMSAAAGNYKRAAGLDPDDAGLKEAVKRLDKENRAEEGMGVREGGRFIVKFEGGENATAGHLIGILLEEAYMKVGSDLGFYPGDTITALLYSKERFRDITRSPSWSGGIYDGRIKLPAGGLYEKTAELEKVVFHEYTHAVVHRLSRGRAPVWLNEGIALYEEGRRSAEYADYLKGLAETGKIDLKSLEGSFMGLSAESAQVAYLLSLSATEYMIDEFGIFSVSRILEGLGSGRSLPEAVSGALYLSYDDFERLWKESLARR